MSWKTFLAAAGIAGLLATTQSCSKADEMPLAPSADAAAEEKAPTFTLPDLDGVKVSLEEVAKEKPVMLDFWATWCPHCEDAVAALNAIQKDYADKMTLLSVNIQESKETVSKAAKKLGITYRVLLDEDEAIMKLYAILAVPTFIVLDKDLTIKYRGYDPAAAKSAMLKLLGEK